MKTKNEIKQWLIENASYYDKWYDRKVILLRGIDFGDYGFDAGFVKAKTINNDYQEAKEYINNEWCTAKRITNDCQIGDWISNQKQEGGEINNYGQNFDKMGDWTRPFCKVDRLEVINWNYENNKYKNDGRCLVYYLKDNEVFDYEIQDNNKTLKIFITKETNNGN